MRSTNGPEPSRALRWGRAYAGQGDLAQAAAAVADACAEQGLCCTLLRPAGSCLTIEAVQRRAAWYEVLLRALPQQALWLLRSTGRELQVECDFRLFRWYTGVIALVCLAIASTFCAYLLAAKLVPDSSPVGIGTGLLVLAAVPLIFWMVLLLGALGGDRIDRICHQVMDHIAREGGFLDPQSTGGSKRHRAALGVHAAFVGGLAALVALGDPLALQTRSITARILVGWIGIISLMVLSFAFVYVVMAARRGASFRVTALATGTMSAMAVIGWLSPACILLGASDFDAARVQSSLALEAKLAGVYAMTSDGPKKAGELMRGNPEGTPRSWQFRAWLGLGIPLLLVVMSALLGASGVRLAVRSHPQLQRLDENRGRGTYRIAVEGGAFLRLLQAALLGTCALIGFLVLAGVGFVVVNSLIFAIRLPAPSGLNLPEVSAGILALALGLPAADPWVSRAVLATWLFHALASLSLLLASTGQLALARRRFRRHLRGQGADPSHPLHWRAVSALEELSARYSRAPRVRLTIWRENRRIEAFSHRFGLFRPERVLDVSHGALELLDDGPLRALLAHELAHHLRHHCLLDNAMRWLCRFAFTGDGFARAIQDSLGHETEADRAAMEELEVAPMDLLWCIETIQNTAFLLPKPPPRVPRRRQDSGDPPAIGAPAGRLRSNGGGWRDAWGLFVTQYTSGRHLHYWHPAYEHRKAAITGFLARERELEEAGRAERGPGRRMVG